MKAGGIARGGITAIWVTGALLWGAQPSANSIAQGGPWTASAEPGKYSLRLKRPGDSARVKVEGERTVFFVTSVMGIGELEVRRADGKWPKQATVRLRYADGRPLLSLEGFSLTSRSLYVGYHPVADGESRAPFWFPDRAGVVEHRLPPAGTLNLRGARQDAALDVFLPANLLSGKSVTIRWVDHYR